MELVFIHLLLKHSQFGHFYCSLFKDFTDFIGFVQFYQDFPKWSPPPPFQIKDNLFSIEIIETYLHHDGDSQESVHFTDTSGTVSFSPDWLKELRPIVGKMTEEVTDCSFNGKKGRMWRWTREIKNDYSEDEWKLVHDVNRIIKERK